jgi:hypothetical protein
MARLNMIASGPRVADRDVEHAITMALAGLRHQLLRSS